MILKYYAETMRKELTKHKLGHIHGNMCKDFRQVWKCQLNLYLQMRITLLTYFIVLVVDLIKSLLDGFWGFFICMTRPVPWQRSYTIVTTLTGVKTLPQTFARYCCCLCRAEVSKPAWPAPACQHQHLIWTSLLKERHSRRIRGKIMRVQWQTFN